KLPSTPIEPDGASVLGRIRVPLDFVCGEKSAIVPAWRALRTVDCVPRARGPVVIPQAHHHVMLDQPLALIATLRALLAGRQPAGAADGRDERQVTPPSTTSSMPFT